MYNIVITKVACPAVTQHCGCCKNMGIAGQTILIAGNKLNCLRFSALTA